MTFPTGMRYYHLMDSKWKTERKVFAFLEEHRMIQPEDKVILGVSGGADSVCLLFLLLEYSKKVPFSMTVVHVNHGIRQDAGEDAAFVEELCREREIPFFLKKGNVPRLAARQGLSEEDAGRRLRYDAFREAAKRFGGSKIAVAHNSNDRAETMLFCLFRGSGLKGLCGIFPVREEWEQEQDPTSLEPGAGKERIVAGADNADPRSRFQVIRPILCLERQEVEEYLKIRGIPFCHDSTNAGDAYARNRIRHHILPYAEQEVSSGVVGHMCRAADILAETEDYMAGQTREALARCGIFSWETSRSLQRAALETEGFLKEHTALQKRMILALAKELSPTGRDISMTHVEDVLKLFQGTGSRRVDLPMGLQARREYTKVILERSRAVCPAQEEPLRKQVFLPVEGGRTVEAALGSLGTMEFSVISGENCEEVPRNKYTKWFDYDKIKESLTIRCRLTGDFLTIGDGAGHMIHKSLKDYMVTEKIPREIRNAVPLLAEGSHVLWLAGYRISEYYKVCRNTKRILQVQLKVSCPDSGTEDEDGRAY